MPNLIQSNLLGRMLLSFNVQLGIAELKNLGISNSSSMTYSSFADDEEGVTVGALPDDVVALFVESLKV